jgi:hypothetical protein
MLPNFVDWPTTRIQFLLEEYWIRLNDQTPLSRAQGAERQLYQRWVEAMQAELRRRRK